MAVSMTCAGNNDRDIIEYTEHTAGSGQSQPFAVSSLLGLPHQHRSKKRVTDSWMMRTTEFPLRMEGRTGHSQGTGSAMLSALQEAVCTSCIRIKLLPLN